MASFSVPGDIPLPPSNVPVSTPLPSAMAVPTAATAMAGSSLASAMVYPTVYDPRSLAYYNSYYTQQYNSMMTANYGTTVLPATAPVTATLLPQSGVGYDPTATTFTRATTTATGMTGESNGTKSAASSKQSRVSDDDDDTTIDRGANRGNQKGTPLGCWGNEKTMNLNQLLLTNIQQSQYFKVTLYSLKTFNEVIDEIWYNVKHLEPWERGSRKMGGQTGMCGGVRGVGAGGIVSTAFCLLYKLHTLKPTRKQVMSMVKYKDAPNIRALGFLFIRYTQHPDQLWNWFSKYLADKEEVDASSTGGPPITIGNMVRTLLTKLEWYSTLFPRIPIPIQKEIEKKLEEYDAERGEEVCSKDSRKQSKGKKEDDDSRDEESKSRNSRPSRETSVHESSRREDNYGSSRSSRDHRDDRHRRRSLSRERRRSRSPRSSRHRSRDRSRDRSPDRNLGRSRDRSRSRERRRHHY